MGGVLRFRRKMMVKLRSGISIVPARGTGHGLIVWIGAFGDKGQEPALLVRAYP